MSQPFQIGTRVLFADFARHAVLQSGLDFRRHGRQGVVLASVFVERDVRLFRLASLTCGDVFGEIAGDNDRQKVAARFQPVVEQAFVLACPSDVIGFHDGIGQFVPEIAAFAVERAARVFVDDGDGHVLHALVGVCEGADVQQAEAGDQRRNADERRPRHGLPECGAESVLDYFEHKSLSVLG